MIRLGFKGQLKNYETPQRSASSPSVRVVPNKKNLFISVGAWSSEIDYVYGEIDAFEEILCTRGDYCVLIGVQTTASMLEKTGSEHVKTTSCTDFKVSVDDIRHPSTKASNMKKIFFAEIWSAGGKRLVEKQLQNAEKVFCFYIDSSLLYAKLLAYMCSFTW
jgi:hypothetical protein